MSPAAPAQPFISKVLSAALRCAADTGLFPSVVLAQWADETAWGTSRAWVFGNNPAGISPTGRIASYPSEAAGFVAYVNTMNQNDYAPVRAAKAQGPIGQAMQLGASEWAGGHYIAEGSTVPGSALVTIIETNDLTAYDGGETLLPTSPAKPSPQPPPEQEPLMWCTDNGSGGVIATDQNGNFYKTPAIGADLVIATLAEHPTWAAGEAESAGANPCVGIVSWADPTGKWGYCYVTKPTSGNGGFGPYDLYHFGRNGQPH